MNMNGFQLSFFFSFKQWTSTWINKQVLRSKSIWWYSLTTLSFSFPCRTSWSKWSLHVDKKKMGQTWIKYEHAYSCTRPSRPPSSQPGACATSSTGLPVDPLLSWQLWACYTLIGLTTETIMTCHICIKLRQLTSAYAKPNCNCFWSLPPSCGSPYWQLQQFRLLSWCLWSSLELKNCRIGALRAKFIDLEDRLRVELCGWNRAGFG